MASVTDQLEIKMEAYHNTDERGAWEVIKVIVGDDFYLDVACREAPGARLKAKAIASQVKEALMQTMKAQHEQSQK